METVGQDGDDGDGVDEDDLDDSPPGASIDNHGGVGHCLQPVHGYGGQTQGGNIDGDALHQMNDFNISPFDMNCPETWLH